jgi:hypothetical protein
VADPVAGGLDGAGEAELVDGEGAGLEVVGVAAALEVAALALTGGEASEMVACFGERSTIGAGTSVDAHPQRVAQTGNTNHSLFTTPPPPATVRT